MLGCIKLLCGTVVAYDATVSVFNITELTPANIKVRERVVKLKKKKNPVFLERQISCVVLEEKLFEKLDELKHRRETLSPENRKALNKEIQVLTTRYAGYQIHR